MTKSPSSPLKNPLHSSSSLVFLNQRVRLGFRKSPTHSLPRLISSSPERDAWILTARSRSVSPACGGGSLSSGLEVSARLLRSTLPSTGPAEPVLGSETGAPVRLAPERAAQIPTARVRPASPARGRGSAPASLSNVFVGLGPVTDVSGRVAPPSPDPRDRGRS